MIQSVQQQFADVFMVAGPSPDPHFEQPDPLESSP